MKTKVINTFITIFAICVGYPMYFAMTLIGYILAMFGKASKYTNCYYANGKRLDHSSFMTKFGLNREEVLLRTDQGNLILVHGAGEGLYMVGTELIGEYKLAKLFPYGNYIVSSCGNGLHEDFSIDGKTFIRDKNTISDFCSIMIAMPWGTMITYGAKFVSVYAAIVYGTRYWKHIPGIIAHEDKSAKRYAELSK